MESKGTYFVIVAVGFTFSIFYVICIRTDNGTILPEEPKILPIECKKQGNLLPQVLHQKNVISRSRVSRGNNFRNSSPYYNDFVEDHIPNTKLTFSRRETIHVCITVGGASTAVEVRFLLRSLYLHARRNNLFFHFLVTGDVKKLLMEYLSQFTSPAVKISYEFIKFDPDFVKRRAKSVNVSITHHSGVFGMSKSFMYDMLTGVERCMILDTDLVFGTDPAFLWAHFKDMDSSYVGALKLGKVDMDMCSGVMLQRFSKMRETKFDSFYKVSVPKFCEPIKNKGNKEYFCRFGDQSMIFAVQLRSKLFANLGDSWNLELCHGFRGHSLRSWRQSDNLFFGIVHFNCLQLKRNLETIDDYMRKYSKTKLGQYLLFLDEMKS